MALFVQRNESREAFVRRKYGYNVFPMLGYTGVRPERSAHPRPSVRMDSSSANDPRRSPDHRATR